MVEAMTSHRLLTDGFGRRLDYLRVSVTDRCDMRCDYCMPRAASRRADSDCDLLSLRALFDLVAIMARFGIGKVRLTGGEPLIRRGIVRFISELNGLSGLRYLALTTNGARLASMAADLKRAGLAGVNVSLDTLDRKRFKTITGTDKLSDVLAGIERALEVGFDRVKINMVVRRGHNDDEIGRFAQLTRSRPVQVRFIEFAPSTPSVWDESLLVRAEEIRSALLEHGDLLEHDKEESGGPARVYRFPGAAGSLGLISAVSDHFCGECNRLRLTSKGELLRCLFDGERFDLGALARARVPVDRIGELIVGYLSGRLDIRRLPRPSMESTMTLRSIGG